MEEGKLSDAFDKTAQYWEVYNRVILVGSVELIELYLATLGSPVPSLWLHPPTHPPTTRKLSNPAATLSKPFRGKGKDKTPAEFVNPSSRFISTHECESEDSHPSEHNSILIVGEPVSESRRAERTAIHDKWDKQTQANLGKGKVPANGWEAIRVQRAEGHEQGFMRPIPDPNL